MLQGMQWPIYEPNIIKSKFIQKSAVELISSVSIDLGNVGEIPWLFQYEEGLKAYKMYFLLFVKVKLDLGQYEDPTQKGNSKSFSENI